MQRIAERSRWVIGVLAVPLILGGVLAMAVAMALLTGSGAYEPPQLVSAGSLLNYKPGVPFYVYEERVWVVRLPETDEMLALYDVDPLSNCAVPYRPDYTYLGRSGWFRDACRGSTYDLAGRCFGGPCEQGLSRFRVFLQVTEVIVDLKDLRAGPPRDTSLTPITRE
jgi:hypothetical protein